MGPAAWDLSIASVRYRMRLRRHRENEASVRMAQAMGMGMGAAPEKWTAWVRAMTGEE
ncbi:hypothetical protein [Methylobacterium iners]|uniref:Uncharacterized protein n=1 Tax=Methylobacterium iners TaxID=418707 RepID=A0ABQ4S361_9HYPH|nr:hypothetical protein [Methylobacterium iners]GJD97481.1 hypothetical protein OCOJLMKI_4712 [Methylobacterium iners]